ncbi:hypothetical protein AAE478_004438 [Parahypoxylon ruwenzoriense]
MKLLSMLVATTLLTSAVAMPAASMFPVQRATGNPEPVFQQNFPDPSIVQDVDGWWYAFGTAGDGKQVQVARAQGLYEEWTLLDIDALPKPGAWTTGMNTWAPDVHRTPDGKYVMYYSGEVAQDSAHHCIGSATADTVTGPYIPDDQPFACDLTVGGAIDPSGFTDADGKQYVLYKIDGNSIGHGGSCGNSVPPIVPTPIMMQEVGEDGVTRIGQPVQIFDRSDDDGPLVEAPRMLLTTDGLYILFFSSGCYLETSYNVNYATSTGVKGPFERASRPILRSGDLGLKAPGGATGVNVGDRVGLAFHANCPEGRCMFVSHTTVRGREVSIRM